jgi:UPF0176 protein
MNNNMNKKEITIINFYGFANLIAPEELMPKILLLARKKSIKGTIILAKEGFNGGISGVNEDLFDLMTLIAKETNSALDEINYKINTCDYHPFEKLKVKLKKEIVAMGIDKIDIENYKGKYLEPKDWDNFISKDDVIMIDTRNNYEVDFGTFNNSINPNTNNFKEFPIWAKMNIESLKNKKIAMFCTGGIRCEKSTAYLATLGAKEVYHLKGGILQYLEDTKNINNNWSGSCFVFDDRISVDNSLKPSKEFSISV